MMFSSKKQALERQIECLQAQLSSQAAEREQAEASYMAEIEALERKVASLEEELAKASGFLDKAKRALDKLRALFKKDSSSSDKPPSSNPYKKPKPQSLREKSGRKPGGQPGHAGHTLPLFPEPTYIIDKPPGPCGRCGVPTVATGRYTAKQEVDIEVIVNITEERAHEGVCPICGAVEHGEHGDGYSSPVHYGDNVKAAVALASEYGNVSVSKTSEIVSSLTGGAINLSWGTIVNMQRELSRKLDETVDTIRAGLLAGRVMGGDETGCRVNGGLRWIQVFCNDDFALFGINDKRGDIDGDFGILAYFVGILVHDHFCSYYKFGDMTHAECNEHILRTLKGLALLAGHVWIGDMADLLRRACHEKNELVRRGKTKMAQREIDEFSARYDEIIKKGWGEYALAVGPDKKNESAYVEEKRLLTRLAEYKDEHILFLNDFDVPFSNNASEICMRVTKGKAKTAGGFRSEEGAKVYARIISLITTLRKQHRNVYEGILAVYSGTVPISSA